MVDKYKPLVLSRQTSTPPRAVLAAAWATLALLCLLYAHDIRHEAEAAEGSSLLARCAPLAQELDDASRGLGVAALRRGCEAPVQALYDAPLILAQRNGGGAEGHVTEQTLATRHFLLTALGSPARAQTKPAPAAQAQVPAAKPQPQRVLIIGASSIQESLGIELERRLEQYQGITVLRFGRYSSGLARPDYFDWPEKLAQLQQEFKPDLILAQWGGNDCQGISSKEGAFVAKFGTAEWDSAYAKRVDAIVRQMQQEGCHAVMIGMPSMRDKSFFNKIKRLDKVTEAACTAAGGGFLSTIGLTTDAKGKFLDQVEFNGKTRLMRAGDGIHFTDHGAAYVAYKLSLLLEQQFTLVAK